MNFKTFLTGAVMLLGLVTGAQAQTGDPSAQGLAEQVRALTGRVEELNFQILQLQEQLRKMQEDNDFRFQELEGGKKSDAGGATTDRQAAEAPAVANDPAPQIDPQTGTAPATGGEPMDTLPGDAATGAQPTVKTFGTITFDQSGNVVGGGVGDQATVGADPSGAQALPGADNTVVAALPQTDDPEALYRSSYDHILGGEYATAEAGFAEHSKRFPDDVKAADARFWLGEAQLGQRKYREAAETFLTASKKYPDSRKTPEMLLKLGVSLTGLNQPDIACQTFAEIGKRYPKASAALKDRVAYEQAQASC